MSKQRRWSCNHSDVWHTISNVCKFAFMNKIPIETDIQQAVMSFWGHSQGMFIEQKSVEHMCWTNTWAGINTFLNEKVRKILPCRALSSSASGCFWKDWTLAAELGVGSPWGTANIALLDELWKCARVSHHSPQWAILSHSSLPNHPAWRRAWKRGSEPSWHLSVLENLGGFFLPLPFFSFGDPPMFFHAIFHPDGFGFITASGIHACRCS